MEDNQKQYGLTSIVLALISYFLPVEGLDLIIGIAAIIFAILGLQQEKKGLAIAGLIIGIFAVVGALYLSLIGGYDFLF